jgi:hypothetical protein
MPGLRDILDAAMSEGMTITEVAARIDASVWLEDHAPELASLVLDMGEALRRLIAYEESYEGVTSPDNALLARLDRLGAADETQHGKEQTT